MEGRSLSCLLAMLIAPFLLFSQADDELDILKILEGKDRLVDKVLRDKEEYRLQFSCTVFQMQDGKLTWTNDNLLTQEYFYPASTVKVPVAILTLEKMNRLGLKLDDQLVLHSDVSCGNLQYIQVTQPDGLSFRKLLEEMLVMSNNEYYSILYHFLTPQEIFQRLSELGYSGVHIFRAFNGCELDAQLRTNGFEVHRGKDVILTQASKVMPLSWLANMYTFDERKLIGSKHEYRGEIRTGPYDFNYHLEIPLQELHLMTQTLIVPTSRPAKLRWMINDDQQVELINWMSRYPSECCDGAYSDEKNFPANYYKYFLVGEDKTTDHRTISKIGLSYGFVTETAYVDCGYGCGLLFTVSMYVNSNDTVNDGKYEYDDLARPFLSRVGQILFEIFSR